LQQFAEPVLGVIFLKFADMRFQEVDKELKAEQEKNA